jgi:hypothetical protein
MSMLCAPKATRSLAIILETTRDGVNEVFPLGLSSTVVVPMRIEGSDRKKSLSALGEGQMLK